MSAPEDPQPSRRRRGWSVLRWVGLGGLALVLLLVALHRPILLWALNTFGDDVARSFGFELEGQFSGSVLSDLRVEDVMVRALASNATFQGASASSVAAEFALIPLVSGDFSRAMELVAVSNAQVRLDFTQPAPPEEPEPEEEISEPVNPAAYLPQQLALTNISARLTTPEGLLEVVDASLEHKRQEGGRLSLDGLILPSGRAWTNQVAEVFFGTNQWRVAGLAFDPVLRIDELVVDPDLFLAQEGAAELDGGLLGGTVTAEATLTPHPPEGPTFVVQAEAEALRWDLLQETGLVPPTFAGELERLQLGARGALDAVQSWEGRLTAELADLAVSNTSIGRVTVTATVTNGQMHLDPLWVRGDSHRLRLTAETQLPPGLSNIAAAPVSGTFELALDQKDLGAVAVSADGSGAFAGAGTNWTVRWDGLAHPDEAPPARIHVVASWTNGVAVVPRLAVDWGESNALALAGQAHVRTGAVAFYRADLDVSLRRLNELDPWLRPFVTNLNLAGAVGLNWEGRGSLITNVHRGEFEVRTEDLIVNDAPPVGLAAAGRYGPDGFRLRPLHAEAAGVTIDLEAFTTNGAIVLDPLRASLGGSNVARGTVRWPFDWDAALAGRWEEAIESEGSAVVDLSGSVPELGPVARRFNLDRPQAGSLDFDLNLKGPASAPTGQVSVAVRNLVDTNLAQAGPVDANVNLDLGRSETQVEGTITSESLSPIDLSGSIGTSLGRILSETGALERAPLDLALRMPNSKLDALLKQVPAIKRGSAQAAVDVTVGGTLAEPRVSGDIDVRASDLALDGAAPPLDDLDVGLTLDRSTVRITRGNLASAGGRLVVSGGVDLGAEAGPQLDVALKAEEALLARSADFIIRADADLAVKGGLTNATLSGSIDLVRNRVFQEIEILPIETPGRPAPQIEAAPIDLSLADTPLAGWQFDLRVRSAGPIVLRSNRAAGGAVVDLAIQGTGRAPILEGGVFTTNVTIILPFSRVEVQQGEVRFPGGAGFNPTLNVSAESQVREYTVNIRAYGSAQDPELILSSSPPLTETDILLLLSTGTTSEQAGQSAGALAGRATFLLLQELWAKIRGEPFVRMQQGESFFDRVQFDPVTQDSQAGAAASRLRFRLSDRFYLVGNVNTRGGAGFRVEYELRFR